MAKKKKRKARRSKRTHKANGQLKKGYRYARGGRVVKARKR